MMPVSQDITAPERGEDWWSTLLPNGGTGVITINGRPYHAAVANAEAGGTIRLSDAADEVLLIGVTLPQQG